MLRLQKTKMSNQRKKSPFVVLLLLVLLNLPGVVLSAEKPKTKGAIDAKTFDQLMEAQELTSDEKHSEALQVLSGIKSNEKLGGYAKSQMWNLYAFIYANQSEYRKAIEAYKKVLAEPETTDGLKLTAKYTLAQMYFQIEDYKSVIDFMEDWLRSGQKPTATAHIMLAQAYYQTKAYGAALGNVDKAIRLEQAEGKQVRENWLRLKVALYYEKSDLKSVLHTYEELMRYYPKVQYMKQLAGMYGELGQNKKRLATYDAVYLHGALKNDSEVLNLAYMYLGQDVPYKAGKIIEAGMQQGLIEQNLRNVETLANAWAQANEHKKAIPALERAAKMSDKGLLFARLAGVHFDLGDYAKAAEAARLADQKGGLKRKDNNLMLLGMAMFNLKKYEGALQAFRQAKKSKKSFSDARKWETYTLSEIKRITALEASKFALAEKTKEMLESDESNVEAIGKRMMQSETNGQ